MSKLTNKQIEERYKKRLDMENKRKFIIEPYKDSPTWPDKVKKMPDRQVCAIYDKFVDSIKKKNEKQIEQLTIFDI